MSKVPAYNFSKEELEGLRKQFNAIDSDKNGYLSEKELFQFMQACGIDTRFIKAIYKVFDTNNDNSLSFDEFVQYLGACTRSQTEPTYLFQLIFDAIDADHDHELDANEMVDFGKVCSMPMTLQDAQAELKRLDRDKNGKLSFKELCAAFGI
ncbi:hypothetical protein M9Y10_009474 [Tritrichomonas musculus]|uniref:EF-hand domain-containing protein n=1 Tax=Tritrichomonas musculus TaxID=1915356 RepID=A0ABR2ING1_9EUKA